MSPAGLVAVAALAVALLLILVVWMRIHAFLALLLCSLLTGVAAGMDPDAVLESVQEGMGGTLGFIAVVVGLGAIFGEMLQSSGGAQRIASTLMARLGEGKVPWALGLSGLLIAIPVFFDVGLVILMPLIYSLGRRSGRSLLYYGIPLLAGLAVAHAFIPPTPGPMAVAQLIHADVGLVILYGIVAGTASMMVAGPFFGRYIAARIHVEAPPPAAGAPEEDEALPDFASVLALVCLPLLLIVARSFVEDVLDKDSLAAEVIAFVGHPFCALILACLASFWILGRRRGLSRDAIQRICTRAFEPVGVIVLVTGAGGVFKQVLIDSEVGDVLGQAMAQASWPVVMTGFAMALLVRLIQGSSTVAMVTAAGLMAPILEAAPPGEHGVALVAISVAAGATACSHVNDSGFWLVSRYFGMNELQTLKSWTAMETLIGITGLTVALVLSLFVM